MNENYNNSSEGNKMCTEIDKSIEAGKKFVVLTVEEIDDIFAVSGAATQVLDSKIDRIQAEGRVVLSKHLFSRLISAEDAKKKIDLNS